MGGLCVALITRKSFLRPHIYQDFPNSSKEWEESEIPPSSVGGIRNFAGRKNFFIGQWEPEEE